MSDVLKQLGLEPEQDDHPADITTLKSLGLKPETDESNPLPRPDDKITNPKPGYKHVIPTPESLVMKAAKNFMSNEAAPADMMGKGLNEVFSGQPASGVGHIGLGAAGTLGAGVQTLVTDPLTSITGNPDFAEKASMFVPIPVGGKTVKGVNALSEVISPTTRAADLAVKMAGPENVLDMLARLKNNPRLRPLDVNDNLRVGAQGLVDPSNASAMNAIVNSTKASAAAAKSSVKGLFDTSLGPAPKVLDELDRLTGEVKKVGKTQIQPALDAAKPVDVTPVIDAIDAKLKPGVQAVANPGTQITPTSLQQELATLKQDLTDGSSLLTDPNRLHEVQSDLRRHADELMKSSVGSEKRLGRQLMDFRNKLVDQIDAAGPKIPNPEDPTKTMGAYKQGLAGYKDANDVQKAFEDGRNILVNSADVKTYPDYLERWLKDASPEEIAAKKLGARDAIERKMVQFKFAARRGTDVPEIDFDKQKMELLFGKEQTKDLFTKLQDERDIALSNNRILGNSKTAETLAAQKALAPREVTPPSGHLPSWAMGAGAVGGALTHSPEIGAAMGGGVLGLSAIRSGAQYLGRRSDQARNSAFANLVSSSGVEREEAIRQLTAALGRHNERNKLSHLLPSP